MPKITEFIEGDLSDYDLEYRIHATHRMFQRNIHGNDVELILREGDVIERYDDDYPLPSVLISGRAAGGRPLHLVVGMNLSEQKLVIITVYEPNILKWSKDFSGRSQ
ncbi:MAG: DUF4258 domain-containing protein [Gammaproteobacteria bacterium]|nr:DUF4258 domain-containing protein [Gammaproteobacteria bacterium]